MPLRARACTTLIYLAVFGQLGACAEQDAPARSGETDPTDTVKVSAESAGDVPEKPTYVVFAEYVNPEDSLPRLRFRADGQVSLNDRCPVRKVKLNPKMPPAYVNGRPIGFC